MARLKLQIRRLLTPEEARKAGKMVEERPATPEELRQIVKGDIFYRTPARWLREAVEGLEADLAELRPEDPRAETVRLLLTPCRALAALLSEIGEDAACLIPPAFELGERLAESRWRPHAEAATARYKVDAGPHSPFPPAFRAKWGRRARRVYEQTLAKTRSRRLAGKARNALLLSAEMSRDVDNMRAKRRSEYRRKYPSATPEKVAAEAGKVSRPSWQALKEWSEDAAK